MANRFAIEREEGFTVVHFGLVNRAGSLLDRFSCVFPEHTLKSQRENLVQYSDKIGPTKKKIPSWAAPARKSEETTLLPVIDFVHVSQWDDAHAEICFWNFSQGHLADIVRAGGKEPIAPWGVALVRCEIDLQRAFLAALYEDAL